MNMILSEGSSSAARLASSMPSISGITMSVRRSKMEIGSVVEQAPDLKEYRPYEDGAIDSLIDQHSFGVAYVGLQRVVRWERQATRGRSDAQDCNCKSSGKHIPKRLPRAMRLRSRADRDRFPGI